MTVKELMNSGLIYGGNLVYVVNENEEELARFLAKNFDTHCEIGNLEVNHIVNGYNGLYITTK